MNATEPTKAYDWLIQNSKEAAYIDSLSSLLGWELRTIAPARGKAYMAEQLSYLAKKNHQINSNPKIGECLGLLESSDLVKDPLSIPAVNIREWRRSYDRTAKIPERLAVVLAQTTAEAETAWEAARPANDWKSFKPHLKKIFDLKNEEAQALGLGREKYDSLLNDFEPGETTESLISIFGQLRNALVALLDKIDQKPKKKIPAIRSHFPIPAQEEFGAQVAKALGYDFEAGRLDRSAHPFSTTIGPGDSRITSRYNEEQWDFGLGSTIHEVGHALYEQGLPEAHWGEPFARAISLGIHESQSRFWENTIARSRGFWKYFYPKAQKHFPAIGAQSLDDYLTNLNQVQRGLIRVDADEVTYNLHILLRFELELALLKGELSVDDLPEAWNQKMKSYLGIVPPDMRSGVMQDVHWSGGMVGYFPTYTLGNLYASQFAHFALQDLGDLDAILERGDFRLILQWLRQHIHQEGSRYRPRELVKKVTGEALNPQYLISHLENRYLKGG